MTYCLGLYLEEGLVLLSDTRTNAGVDNVSTYCKMYHFQEHEERMIVLLSSGNLAVTQAVLHRVTNSNFKANEDSEKKELPQNLEKVADLYQAAELVGDAVREVYQHDGKALEALGAGFQVSFLLGGQIRGEPMRLFQIGQSVLISRSRFTKKHVWFAFAQKSSCWMEDILALEEEIT